MTSLDERFRVKTADVAAEVMDGEAIIINLATGVYYSMAGPGARLWSMVDEGHSLGAVADELHERYQVERARVEEDVLAVARELLGEGLLEVAEREAPAPSQVPDADDTGGEYRPPTLEVYRDMEELLALDPPMPGLQDTGWREDEGVQAPGEE